MSVLSRSPLRRLPHRRLPGPTRLRGTRLEELGACAERVEPEGPCVALLERIGLAQDEERLDEGLERLRIQLVALAVGEVEPGREEALTAAAEPTDVRLEAWVLEADGPPLLIVGVVHDAIQQRGSRAHGRTDRLVAALGSELLDGGHRALLAARPRLGCSLALAPR
eukprot:CAMPEP_0119528248 /NCGR_PEP_ID=MMETSP1344-20130328/42497_1 /TAXON_ID=236787 /ORGANISM="Florenciella parvula, Strain CCMP2471" /LENGTH=166 /DNA_ID=CAMNT_0007567615 /DNA_START=311 /DNA_END=807 /DNA_ORIENTATION=+